MLPGRKLLIAAGLGLWSGPALAQAVFPPAPETYRAEIRYRIRADRDGRIVEYRALSAALAAAGFKPDAESDTDQFDPTAERFAGTVPGPAAGRLFDDPRVQTVLLVPTNIDLAADAAKAVPVRLSLAAGLELNEQRLLHEQTVARLGLLGFVENVGYDHRTFTRVRGAIPAGKVATLLKDLRDQPGGWFASDAPRDNLPYPLRSTLAVRVVEVLPDVAGLPATPAVAPAVGKITPDLRAALSDSAEKSLRVEVAFDRPMDDSVRELRVRLRTVLPGAAIEGVVGSLVTVRLAKGADLEKLIQSPQILAARLPRVGTDAAAAGKPAKDVLAAANVPDLHARGHRGKGTRIAVVGSDFSKLTPLPKGMALLDLTGETTDDLNPLPAGGGNGHAAALAAQAAAPDADIVLVRINPAAYHQLLTVGRAALGTAGFSAGLASRGQDLIEEADILGRRRDLATDEYQNAFKDLSDDDKPAKRRDDARAAIDKIRGEEVVFRAKYDRFSAIKAGLDALAGTTVVVNTLSWETGQPQDGLCGLSEFLVENFTPAPARSAIRQSTKPPPPAWVQAAADGRGAVWAGPYADIDGNGVLEFGPGTPQGTWTAELNFLKGTLPAGTKLRITGQWREPQSPDALPGAVYVPVFRLLKQLDPTGKTAASDELAEVARSANVPVRILATPTSAAYEHTLEVTIPADGRYALRIEGRTVQTTGLPAQRRNIEVNPRVVVESLDGKPVAFETFAPVNAGVGIPGGAFAALTAGGDASLTGAGPGVTLRAKPDVVVSGAGGSSVAAGYAGGIAAALAGVGVKPLNLTRTLGLTPGAELKLPPLWLQAR